MNVQTESKKPINLIGVEETDADVTNAKMMKNKESMFISHFVSIYS